MSKSPVGTSKKHEPDRSGYEGHVSSTWTRFSCFRLDAGKTCSWPPSRGLPLWQNSGTQHHSWLVTKFSPEGSQSQTCLKHTQRATGCLGLQLVTIQRHLFTSSPDHNLLLRRKVCTSLRILRCKPRTRPEASCGDSCGNCECNCDQFKHRSTPKPAGGSASRFHQAGVVHRRCGFCLAVAEKCARKHESCKNACNCAQPRHTCSLLVVDALVMGFLTVSLSMVSLRNLQETEEDSVCRTDYSREPMSHDFRTALTPTTCLVLLRSLACNKLERAGIMSGVHMFPHTHTLQNSRAFERGNPDTEHQGGCEAHQKQQIASAPEEQFLSVVNVITFQTTIQLKNMLRIRICYPGCSIIRHDIQ